MLEGTEPRERIISAALRLAETRSWRDLSLGEIAAEAGIPLLEFRHAFQSKAQVLAAFSRLVDKEVLKKFAAPGKDVPRDRLFDVILTRLETLQPYKAALRRIAEDATLTQALSQAGPALKSQYWMLAAAGISGEGGLGLLRVRGLLAIYSRIFAIWLDDDDPGMARTMAALDRRLRRGESFVHGVERICGGIDGLRRALRGKHEETKPETPTPEGSGRPSGPEGEPLQV